jgi:hypothetical protein
MAVAGGKSALGDSRLLMMWPKAKLTCVYMDQHRVTKSEMLCAIHVLNHDVLFGGVCMRQAQGMIDQILRY